MRVRISAGLTRAGFVVPDFYTTGIEIPDPPVEKFLVFNGEVLVFNQQEIAFTAK